MRLVGLLLLLGLLALNVGLRERAGQRADDLFAGEAQARERLASLGDALRAAGEIPGEERLELFRNRPDLRPLAHVGDASSAYAEDAVYVYGLGLTTEEDREGSVTSSWVLRAWPREFGVTGDLEFHLDRRGVLYIGQNEVGRSGTDEGFPPSFPQRNLGKTGPWWLPGAQPKKKTKKD